MPFDPKTVFTVGQVNEYIKYLLEDSPVLDSIYVTGEISNLTAYHTSGHIYFSVKDETGVLRAVMFRSAAQRLKFRPENGMRVLLHGRITVYAPSGQYQLNADAMEPERCPLRSNSSNAGLRRKDCLTTAAKSRFPFIPPL